VSLLELGDDVDEVPQAATEAVEPPHHERVAGTHVVKARVELRALADRPGPDVFEDAGAAGLLERVELQREVLLAGGDPGVADPLTTSGWGVIICAKTRRGGRYPTAPGAW
jgi:hypothetical protein